MIREGERKREESLKTQGNFKGVKTVWRSGRLRTAQCPMD